MTDSYGQPDTIEIASKKQKAARLGATRQPSQPFLFLILSGNQRIFLYLQDTTTQPA
jgi:hypothetical protein